MFTSRLAVLFAAACTLLALIRVELFATRQQPPVSTIRQARRSAARSLWNAVKRRQQKERGLRTGGGGTRLRRADGGRPKLFLAALGTSDVSAAAPPPHQVVKPTTTTHKVRCRSFRSNNNEKAHTAPVVAKVSTPAETGQTRVSRTPRHYLSNSQPSVSPLNSDACSRRRQRRSIVHLLRRHERNPPCPGQCRGRWRPPAATSCRATARTAAASR